MPWRSSRRSLLQSSTSCPDQIPACMPRRCTTRTVDGTKGRYVCLRCKAGYVPVLSSDRKSIIQCSEWLTSLHCCMPAGLRAALHARVLAVMRLFCRLRAVCPAGTYEHPVTQKCEPCPIGAFCRGGNRKASRAADDRGSVTSCNPRNTTGLTTKSEKSTSAAVCSESPGTASMPAFAQCLRHARQGAAAGSAAPTRTQAVKHKPLTLLPHHCCAALPALHRSC